MQGAVARSQEQLDLTRRLRPLLYEGERIETGRSTAAPPRQRPRQLGVEYGRQTVTLRAHHSSGRGSN